MDFQNGGGYVNRNGQGSGADGLALDTEGGLYVCSGDKVYRRLTRVKGVRSAGTPVKPPAPRL